MASTYSDALRIELIGTGEQNGTWGDTTNTNLGTLIESAIAGWVSVTHDDAASYTLTTNNGSADEARNMILHITGTLTANRNVVCPTQNKLYVIKNGTTGGYSVTLKTSGGTGIAVPNGKTMVLYCNGTNVLDGVDYVSSLGIAGALAVTGNATVSGTLGVTGAATFSSTVAGSFNGSIGATTPSTGKFTSVDVVNTKGVYLWADSSVSYVSNTATANSEYFVFDPAAHTITIGTNNSSRGQFTNTGLNSCAVGATTASTGTFTTLLANTKFRAGGVAEISASYLVEAITTGTTLAAILKNDAGANAYTLRIHNAATSGDNLLVAFTTDANTDRGSIDFNRAGTAVRYNTTSDASVKTNRRNLSIEDVDTVFAALDAEEWDWDSRYATGSGRGFVAQVVHALVPDAVSVGSTDKEFGEEGYRMWGMDASFLVPYLWTKVKSLSERLSALENP